MVTEAQMRRMTEENSDASMGEYRPVERQQKLGKKVTSVTVGSVEDRAATSVEVPRIKRTEGHGSFA